jgi:thiamine-phosphate pyrophosphorylase
MSEERLQRRRRLLLQARFYGILDTNYVPSARLEAVTEQLIAGGCQLIQLRAKAQSEAEVLLLAQRMAPLFANSEVLFVINDWPRVAQSVGADGVHVGQEDMPLEQVRSLLAADQLIGKSTHSLSQAVDATKEKPDYIGVGPLYATPTKPTYHPVGLSLIQQVKEQVDLPQFCIGGIHLGNLAEVLAAGATRVVIVSGILQAGDITAYGLEVGRLLERGRQLSD